MVLQLRLFLTVQSLYYLSSGIEIFTVIATSGLTRLSPIHSESPVLLNPLSLIWLQKMQLLIGSDNRLALADELALVYF